MVCLATAPYYVFGSPHWPADCIFFAAGSLLSALTGEVVLLLWRSAEHFNFPRRCRKRNCTDSFVYTGDGTLAVALVPVWHAGRNNTRIAAMAKKALRSTDCRPQSQLRRESLWATSALAAFVQTGEHVMIGGFIVQGSGPKECDHSRYWARAHAQYGITRCIGQSEVGTVQRSGALIGPNDDWQTTIIGGVITAIRSATFRTVAALRLRQASRRSLLICNRATHRDCQRCKTTPLEWSGRSVRFEFWREFSLDTISTRSFCSNGRGM